jgi:anti-sigma factor RsiW
MSDNNPERSLREEESRLAAYHDGELSAAEKSAFEGELAHLAQSAGATEPRTLKEWSLVGDMVRGALEIESEALPEARFEQLWDGFDRTLARDARLQTAANATPTWSERLVAWLKPAAMPLGLAAAAAAVALVMMPGEGVVEPASNPTQVAANESKEAPQPAPAPEPAPMLAEAPKPAPTDAEFFPRAASNEADIERIEFGGRSGTISKIEGSRGTTTVIWVQEDEEPVDSERSL